DLDWPTLILDVDDAEADLLLATHDPLATLAEYDKEKLAALLQQVETQHEAVSEMLRGLAKKQEIAAEGVQGKRDSTLPAMRCGVVDECEDEEHQREILDRLTEEGLTCRVLTF